MQLRMLGVLGAAAVLVVGCGGSPPVSLPTRPTASPTPTARSAPAPAPSRAGGTAPAVVATRVAGPVEVRLRIEGRTADAATRGFAGVVAATLADPRGWVQAGFRIVVDPSAAYAVVLGEPAEVDALCRPYDTYGKYSCQNGPVVALNAERWRHATPEWTGDLATYRQMLVNHEVGHLLGQHHPPSPQCPVPGRPALAMSQQSTELNGCRPNPWPLPEEISRAATHSEPLAPPYSG